MAELPDTAYFTLAPDWVCEVLSASTRKLDLHEKRPVYARESCATGSSSAFGPQSRKANPRVTNCWWL